MSTVQVGAEGPEDGFVRVDAIFSEDAGTVIDDPSMSLGERLRYTRTRFGITLDSASARTRLKRDYLEGFEHMDPRALPTRAYAVGYLRTYAQFLKLDPDECVQKFKEELDVDAGRATPTAPQARREIKLPRGVFGVIIILAGVIAAGGWYGNYISQNQVYAGTAIVSESLASSKIPLVSVDQLPSPSQEDVWGGLPNSAGSQALIFEAARSVYLEVRDTSGRILVARNLRAGDVYRAPDEAGLTLSTSDAGAILVRAAGRPVGPIGESGVALDNISAAEFMIAAFRNSSE